MILQRTETNETIDAIYESSNILASSYDKKHEKLVVTFKRGAQYEYAGVPMVDYTRFELAESQGKIFNSHIKKFPYKSLGTVDVSELQDGIVEAIKREIAGYEKDLYDRTTEALRAMSGEDKIEFKVADLSYMKRAIDKIIELKGQLSVKI